jgi:hypothetical protein
LSENDKPTLTEQSASLRDAVNIQATPHEAAAEVIDTHQCVRQGIILGVPSGKANIEPPPFADNGKPDYQSRLDTFSKQMRAWQFWQRAD